ncbi:MAG: hypothetical protein LBR19_00200 [Bifidobacteriaceae bacterium]|jgi:hypothetical protein|nr:hypothetical protein [Bifidobacteriaceae bacterium]
MRTLSTSGRPVSFRRITALTCALALGAIGLATAPAIAAPPATDGVVAAPAAPTVTLTAPQITGEVKVGSAIRVVAEAAPVGVAQVTYQWFRGTNSVTLRTPSPIYVISPFDAGSDLVAKVFATGPANEVVKYSNHIQVPGEPLVIDKDFKVDLNGPCLPGGELEASLHLEQELGEVTIAYQWFRGTSLIGGATGDSYTTTPGDAGKDIVVKVTITRNGVTIATKYSNHVVIDEPITVTQPVIPATHYPLQLMQVTGLEVKPADAWVSYQWFVDGRAAITGITPYFIAFWGQNDIVLKVTVTKPGYDTVVKYSNHSFPAA